MKLYDVPVILCFVGALMVLDFDKGSVKALITGVLLGLQLRNTGFHFAGMAVSKDRIHGVFPSGIFKYYSWFRN